MTRTRSPRSAKKRPSSGLRPWLGWALKLGLVALVVLAGFAVYLDAVVQEKFSGKRWTIPAKVYARPLELFVGQKLSKDDFLTELDALGYRRESVVNGPGAASVSGNTVELNTRGFQFYEGMEQAQPVRVRFSGDYVAELSGSKGSKLAVVRLEPLLIGGLYPKNLEDRILIKIDQVPPYLLETLVAVEDRDFYSHFGVSPKSIARAVWVNTSSGAMRQGGSTLTQQLVKNFYLTNERSLSRKLTEAMMALLLELHYDKREILEAYLNEVFIGQDGQRAVHGFGLASQFFFSQPLAELKLHQIALLVGMVKGPSYYNPRRYPERALERRNLVLDLLAQQGVATPEQVEAAKKMPLGVTKRGSLADSSFPGFLDLVKRQLREDYRDEDLTEEGLRIFTSFDPILQMKAEASVGDTFKRLAGRKGSDEVEAAMVVTNPETGEVQAMIGSRQAGFAGFNRALDAVRPIGSLIKPAVYLTALEKPSQYTLTSWLSDEAFSVKGGDGQVWKPQNYDRRSHGTVFLYQGLAHSYNLSTARLGLEVGVPNVLKTLGRLGVTREFPAFPSMLLGAGGLSPMEVATMYQTLANGGFNTPMRGIRSVLTAEGEPLKRYPFQIQQRFDPGSIYLIQSAMQRVMREGTGSSVYNVLPRSLALAGKTGTSNDSRDSWFAGFSQDLLAVVWLGRDDNGKTPFTGATGALQVWTSFMRKADPLPLDMPQPDNVVQAWVDSRTGQGSDANCPGAVQMPYIRGSEPPPGPACGGDVPAPVESVMDWVKGWMN
ncbi:Multimodular transpeptidase-transglycosylase [Pseudomonas chlororaphis subsp. aurantiaca]|uniref:penicillin-binding protein 1B n=1 Tax=Pseudomonas chlororaphis TaxID=587753 RepID=UPI000864C142|nr:penicillin-binding protein 1B [Pseudomonas chlororaphis]AZD24519.1 Multimodular transpeptidase-transglycosylase [Pseudomonas chlororaphis subsp. aurantiaca]AZD38169.1 Multimodular transpeptidase-transglycosylase [Pseudomonas chlororaphis subsp. aurantiaca]AZD44510.1 Multimodular transpeptidase-transglycosylase [Pseudomonas chlororaphis subsp. aurantiaca]AZD50808.1 Multimodular transpeptidase-transglycosylase [Pseudomonas chlororaphis subsp. aurantiaca]AZD57068.1 Multimodular transpeptidase-